MTTKTVRVRRNGASHLTYVESSSEEGKRYEIARIPGGIIACSCMGWAFSKDAPKTCRHLRAYKAANGATTYREKQRAVPAAGAPKRMPVEPEETFTFVRGMSFDDIPT